MPDPEGEGDTGISPIEGEEEGCRIQGVFHCRQDEDEKTPSRYVLRHVRAIVCPLTTHRQLGEGKEDLEEGNVTLL